jgi:8-oxo-dGTP pyrophosphatase MutT (NUDIX family)
MPHDFERRLRGVLDAHEPNRIHVPEARAAAVLIAMFDSDDPKMIFTVRTDTVSSHKGQISFPGGSIDETDESPAAAALRETHEEIGLDPSFVRLVGELDSFPTFVSGYVVTPFVGWLDEVPPLEPNPAEVAEILMVPLGKLSDEIRAEPGFTREGRTYPTEAWIWDDHVIWGVTAYIIRGFLTKLGEAGLATPPSTESPWFQPPPRLT